MEVENVNVKNWKSLIKPSKLDVQISDDLTHAKIIAEPLEKGYGLTLGNSLKKNFTFINKRCCCYIYSN
jgi:DNA-directed RNA polymerase subunit alpha